MTSTRRLLTVVAITLLAGCSSATATTTTAPALLPTASAPSSGAARAMSGFLTAAAADDNSRIPSWLATSEDTADLAEVVSVYGTFATEAHAGLFWEVRGLRVVGVSAVDANDADVALNGDVVWCLGTGADDPTASCEAVNGVAGRPHTYRAVAAAGSWRVDIDIHASSQLEGNPLASPAPGSPAPTSS